MKSKPVILAIIHSYMPDRRIDPYFSGLLNAFENQGVEVHLILANDLVGNLGARGLKTEVSESKIIKYINALNPDFIFNSNRGGITKEILEKTVCPIITWMVDLMPFLHHGGDHKDLFCERDYLITSSYQSVEVFEKIYPILKNRVFFIPVATNISDFMEIKFDNQDINISFVGSLFDYQYFNKIIDYCNKTPWAYQNFLMLSECIRQDYYLDIEKKVSDLKLNFILKNFSIDAHFLKAIISNVISNNDRIKYLEAISDLGFNLYGTDNWTAVGQYSISLLKAFRFDKRIDTRKKLVEVYQRSKISINISHNQAVNGLPYRIYDIMASDSMLITNYRKDSDIFLLFGNDFPIPMYRDTEELRRKVKYFLKHENERIQIVKECQKAISKGFSFIDRVRQFYEIVGKPLIIEDKNKGKIVNLNSDLFIYSFHRKLSYLHDPNYNPISDNINFNLLSLSISYLRSIIRIVVLIIIYTTTQEQRNKIKNRIRSSTSVNLRIKLDSFIRKLGIVRTHQ